MQDMTIKAGDFATIIRLLMQGYRIGDKKRTFYYYYSPSADNICFHNSIIDIVCEYIHFANMEYIAWKSTTRKLGECRCSDIECKDCPLNWVCVKKLDKIDTTLTLYQVAETLNINGAPMSVASALKEELEKEVKVDE